MQQTFITRYLESQNSYQRTLHFHDINEIFFSLNDKCSFFLCNQVYSIQRGVFILIPEGSFHRKVNPSNLAVNTYTIHYPVSMLETYSTPGTDLLRAYGTTAACVQLPEASIDTATAMFDRCLMPADGEFGSDLRRNMCFLDLLLEFHPLVSSHLNAGEVRANASPLVSELMGYIAQHLAERLSLDRLAGEFFISKYNLCRQFKRETGFTVVEYVNSSRVRLACSILRKEKQLNNIGARVGFPNASHFINTFRQFTGVTPHAYVNQYRDYNHALVFNNFSPHNRSE